MRYFLVEEHKQDPNGDQVTSFRYVVPVASLREDLTKEARYAFRLANEHSKEVRAHVWFVGTSQQTDPEPIEFAFAAEELEEVTPGFLWEAADGSMVAYEVRYLGDFTTQPYSGTVEVTQP